MYLDLDNVPFYIGKGKKNRHLVGIHLSKCSPNRFLKNKIRKVGAKNVKIHFLHKNISEEEAFYWESYWIKYIGRRDLKEGTLCNLTDGGEGTSGRECSEETKRRVSKANKGKKNGMYGKHHSEEIKNKIRVAAKGKPSGAKGKPAWNSGKVLGPRSEETRQKISAANKGKVRSFETCRKISVANKGKVLSKETKQKLSEVNKGKKMSKVARQKMSEAAKLRWSTKCPS